MNKASLLELAKKLNIPHQNCMKTKEDLKKPSTRPSQGTKRLFLVQIPPPVWHVWMNFKSSRSFIKKYMIKSWWKIQWESLYGRDFKEILWLMVTRWSRRRQVRCWILKLIPHIGKINFKGWFYSLYRP